jgi:hypothetical protein
MLMIHFYEKDVSIFLFGDLKNAESSVVMFATGFPYDNKT